MTAQDKINLIWDLCSNRFGLDRCVALTLHGSQNYNLDLPDSDVDAKLIVTPTWEEIVFCKEPKSETIQGLFGGDVNVVDVRLFIGNNLKKQNFNFLECLFTPYSRVNPFYADLWERLLHHRERIARYKPDQAIRTMLGQAENQYRRWGKFDDKKTLYHMMRISGAIEAYKDGWDFADTLVPLNQDHIMQVRLGKIGQEDMEYMFDLFYNHIQYLVKEASYKGEAYEWIEVVMDEIQKDFIHRALYEQGIEG